MDLHAPQIQGFFEVPVDHLNSSVVFIPYIKNIGLDNLVIAAPDMGGSARARYFAKNLYADLAICDKHRKRANSIESMMIIGDIEGKNVVIVDDIIDTGGTLSKAASLMMEKGAASVRAFCTHPVLSGDAYETIENSALVELIVCDTIPLKRVSSKIKTLSVASLLAEAIRNVYEHGSISSLFNTANVYQNALDL